MSYSAAEIWTIIVVLGIGTFLIRFSFLGIVGDRKLPPWLLRHLRYTPVAVLPALVAPLVAWPAATGGVPDPLRIAAALTALALGYLTRNVIAAMAGGAMVFGVGVWLGL